MFNAQGSTFGSDKEIWLKAKRNFSVFLDTLPVNLCVVRVHAFMAREIQLLQSQDLSFRFSTSSVQSVQANVENPQETAWPQASASASSISASSVCGQTHTQNSRSTLWPYPSRVELAVSSISAAVHIAASGFAFAQRPLGFAHGRALFPLSRERLGVVCDGGQADPSKSSRLPRSRASARQREPAGLVSRIHNHSRLDSQAYPGLGLRRDCRDYQAQHEPGLDRAVLPLPSHQPIAAMPRPTQSQIGRQTLARSPLPTCPPSSRPAPRRPVASRAQKTQTPCSAGKGLARHTHDRSRVSQAHRPFQSLSQISPIESTHYHRQRRSDEPKNS